MMKLFLALWLTILCVTSAVAQESPLSMHQARARLSIMPVVQIWEGEGQDNYFGELTIPVTVFLPLGRNASLNLRGNGAGADGKNLERLSGLTDVQAALNYRLEWGRSRLLLSLGAGLPSGKKELTNEEYTTAFLLSQNIFRFQAPSFGQGLNVAPGLSLALPLGDSFVIGVGGSYQIKGAYRPLASFSEDYDPGDETTYVSADAIYTLYGKDTLGEDEVFRSGEKLVVSGQVRSFFGSHELWLLGRFRSRAKSEIPINGLLIEEADKTIPNQIEVMGHVRLRASRVVSLRLLGEGRFFDATTTTESLQLFGVGIGPEFKLSEAVLLPLRFKYYTGDYTGAEAALGLVVLL